MVGLLSAFLPKDKAYTGDNGPRPFQLYLEEIWTLLRSIVEICAVQTMRLCTSPCRGLSSL